MVENHNQVQVPTIPPPEPVQLRAVTNVGNALVGDYVIPIPTSAELAIIYPPFKQTNF